MKVNRINSFSKYTKPSAPKLTYRLFIRELLPAKGGCPNNYMNGTFDEGFWHGL